MQNREKLLKLGGDCVNIEPVEVEDDGEHYKVIFIEDF